jgi:hypothetical protein
VVSVELIFCDPGTVAGAEHLTVGFLNDEAGGKILNHRGRREAAFRHYPAYELEFIAF